MDTINKDLETKGLGIPKANQAPGPEAAKLRIANDASEKMAEEWAKGTEQGGHAGGKVASEEELARPGNNYVVKKDGSLTYHGKAFAPEDTPAGAAHVTVLPSGELRVNEGTLSDAGRKALEKAANAKPESVGAAKAGFAKDEGIEFNPDKFRTKTR
jgi:hypothetical protein